MADKYDLAYLSVSELPEITVATSDTFPVYDASAARWGKATKTADLVAAGSTLTLTAATHNNKTILLDTAAGSVVTLPAASGSGATFKFAVSVTATSNSHIVKVANASDFMSGFINVVDLDGTAAAMYKGDGTADDTITLNRTTTGGLIGDTFELVDFKANVWLIRAATISCAVGSNVADPLSATV